MHCGGASSILCFLQQREETVVLLIFLFLFLRETSSTASRTGATTMLLSFWYYYTAIMEVLGDRELEKYGIGRGPYLYFFIFISRLFPTVRFHVPWFQKYRLHCSIYHLS